MQSHSNSWADNLKLTAYTLAEVPYPQRKWSSILHKRLQSLTNEKSWDTKKRENRVQSNRGHMALSLYWQAERLLWNIRKQQRVGLHCTFQTTSWQDCCSTLALHSLWEIQQHRSKYETFSHLFFLESNFPLFLTGYFAKFFSQLSNLPLLYHLTLNSTPSSATACYTHHTHTASFLNKPVSYTCWEKTPAPWQWWTTKHAVLLPKAQVIL